MKSAQLLLVQKSGNYLENLGINLRYDLYTTAYIILKTAIITKCCNTKIKFLEFHDFDDQTIYKLSLNYLTIRCHEDDYGLELLSSIILQNLGPILPSKLEYLNLVLVFNMDDFEIFLKNSQNIFIENFQS
ncbi:hypothetical protein RclHR1_14130001 [Rhizophagus clarus]|uniref:Uncharacterized protein n=1 Tax=Rhizophagus clarus TaxID=94130 RepID=A0A2Z6QBU0_9GLOM|nr:hypothetical protein RclHR1_14130001 [Rhizophagus clarus]